MTPLSRRDFLTAGAAAGAGLVIGFYLPYPPSFFITALAFLAFIGIRAAHNLR